MVVSSFPINILAWALLITAPVFCQSITIDCGSPSDQYFSGGLPYTIAGASGDATLRYGTFGYHIPATAGDYTVTLYMRETGTVTAIGQRIFNVKINDQPVLDRYDLFAREGLAERRRDFDAVSNGFIDIDFSYIRKSAIVSRIELYDKPQSPPSGEMPTAGPGIIITQNPYTISFDSSALAGVYPTLLGGNLFRGENVFMPSADTGVVVIIGSARPLKPRAVTIHVSLTGEMELFNGAEWRRVRTDPAP